MAKFKFSLENILRIKVQLENIKKTELGTLNMKKYDLNKKLSLKNKEIRRITEEFSYKSSGGSGILELKTTNELIMYLKMESNKISQEIKKLEDEITVKVEELKRALIERKTYEKLKEKAIEDYYKEINLEDNKLLDEITSFKYSRQDKE